MSIRRFNSDIVACKDVNIEGNLTMQAGSTIDFNDCSLVNMPQEEFLVSGFNYSTTDTVDIVITNPTADPTVTPVDGEWKQIMGESPLGKRVTQIPGLTRPGTLAKYVTVRDPGPGISDEYIEIGVTGRYMLHINFIFQFPTGSVAQVWFGASINSTTFTDVNAVGGTSMLQLRNIVFSPDTVLFLQAGDKVRLWVAMDAATTLSFYRTLFILEGKSD